LKTLYTLKKKLMEVILQVTKTSTGKHEIGRLWWVL